MINILVQRHFFVTKTFEITSNSLKVNTKKILNYIEDEFAFEDITKQVLRKRFPNLFTALPVLAFRFGLVVCILSHIFEEKGSSIYDIIFYLSLSIVFLGISIFNYENVLLITIVDKGFNKRTLSFFAHSRTEGDLSNFLKYLFSEQKTYLLNKYAKQDPYLTVDQLTSNLKWLRDRSIIDDEELDELRIKILPKPNENISIGFKTNPGSK